jgi:hypothetical protein
VRVAGWDTVSTPAGSFDAIRLEVLMLPRRRDVLALADDLQLRRVVRAAATPSFARITTRNTSRRAATRTVARDDSHGVLDAELVSFTAGR